MSSHQKIRILAVDDNPEVRALFELLMKDHVEFETVGTLSGAESLEDGITRFRPNVVVLDLSMPGRDSIEALTCTRMFPSLGILVFTSVDDPQKIEAAMTAGATGYLVKDGDYDELASGLRKVAAGEKVQPRIGYRYGPSEGSEGHVP